MKTEVNPTWTCDFCEKNIQSFGFPKGWDEFCLAQQNHYEKSLIRRSPNFHICDACTPYGKPIGYEQTMWKRLFLFTWKNKELK